MVIFQIGLESLGPYYNVSDCNLLSAKVSSSVAYVQLKFGNSSCSCPLPACLSICRKRKKMSWYRRRLWVTPQILACRQT